MRCLRLRVLLAVALLASVAWARQGPPELPPASVSGRIYDAAGLPVPGARVQTVRLAYSSDGRPYLRSMASGSPAVSDERGEYRIEGLEPGRYFVRAGRVPPPEAEGAGTVRATYYPGAANPDRAVSLSLAPGMERSAIDFRLEPPAPGYRVAGRWDHGASIEPEPTAISIFLIPRDRQLLDTAVRARGRMAADGLFEIPDVPQGAYTLHVAVRYPPAAGLGGETYFTGGVPLDVGDSDVEDLSVRLEPNVELDGQLVVNDSLLRVTDLDPMRMRIVFEPADGRPPTLVPSPARGEWKLASTGRFGLGDLSRGRYRIHVEGFPPDFYVDAARLGGADVLDEMVLAVQPAIPLVLEMSDAGGRIQGTVVDISGKPVPRSRVVLLPRAADERTAARSRAGFADAAGRFDIRGIRPGSYALFAFDRIEDNAWLNPGVMRTFEDRGIPIDVERSRWIERDVAAIPESW